MAVAELETQITKKGYESSEFFILLQLFRWRDATGKWSNVAYMHDPRTLTDGKKVDAIFTM